MSQDAGTSEHYFVKRMRDERHARGWSQERLVNEVQAKTGYQMNPTVITKLEWALDPARAEKARGLGVNEAVAIAQTFGISLQQMLSPLDRRQAIGYEASRLNTLAARKESQLRELQAEVDQLRDQAAELNQEYEKLQLQYEADDETGS